MEKTKGEQFFELLTLSRIEKNRLLARWTVIIACALLFITDIALFLAFQARKMRAVSVVEICPEQDLQQQIFDRQEASVKLFVNTFVKLYSEQSPDIAQNLSEAYKMMTPRLQEILLARKIDGGKADKWFDKNIKSDIVFEKYRIDSEKMDSGEIIVIMGFADAKFRPAVAFNGDYSPYSGSELFGFYQMSAVIVPVTEKTPHGLLVDYFQIDWFENPELRKAYLLERNISLTKGN